MTTYLSEFNRAKDRAEVLSFGNANPIVVVRDEHFGAYLYGEERTFTPESLSESGRVVARFVDGKRTV